MKSLHRLHNTFSKLGTAALLCAATFGVRTAWATPYASSISVTNGVVSFYLNESGANVTVTYEDGSTNAFFNGLTQGTNLPAGLTNFLLGAHSSYKISVAKVGTGTPSLIKSLSVAGNPRGVDVNKNFGSPYFGRVYEVNGGTGVYLLNADLSYVATNVAVKAGVTTFGSGGTGTGQSPYRLGVGPDDSVYVGDASENGCAVYRIDPNFVTNQLLLGPVGLASGNVPQTSHGTIESRPLVTGSLASSNLVLYTIDGELSPYNSIQVYDIGAGPLPWTNAPTSTGYQVGVGVDSIGLGGNEYPGLTMGPNGYLYCSTYRNNLSNPLIQIYDSTGETNLWDSWEPFGTSYPGGSPTGDFFLSTFSGDTAGLIDSAVTVDGAYVIGESIYNGVTICPLTNGLPNVANLFTVNPTAITANGRGVAWDAADNFYVSSSGLGAVQEWSLGLTATAITAGNATGMTNYLFTVPANTISVVATTPQASQFGPTPGVFTISRSNAQTNYSQAIQVNFTLGGTATNGISYTTSPSVTSSIVIAAGMTSTNITIIPTAGGSFPTETVTLTIAGSGSYSTGLPFKDTVSIQNNGPQTLVITSVLSPTIYKGLTNDPGYFVISRYGDTNAPAYTVSAFTYGGTATSGEFVPAGTITVNPGDTTETNFITPLIDTTNYIGNKTVVVGLGTGTGYSIYTNTGTITILDNQYPPGNVIYSNPLTDPNDATNWGVASANNNEPNNFIDDTIDFGYDLTSNNGLASQNGLITYPPNGATNALRITVNKNSSAGSGAAAGVNLYLTNLFLTGDYAVRFSMDLSEGAVNTTEGAEFGINHTGADTNWWSGSGLVAGDSPSVWSSDGVWYWISADGGAAAGDYIEYTGVGGTNGNSGWQYLGEDTRALFTSVFENPVPYSTDGGPGLIGNGSAGNAYYGTGYTNSWADVQLKTVKNVVTLTINKTLIYTYTNTTVWTNGYVMLGYCDPFSSVGTADASVYFSGLTVVKLTPTAITTQPTNYVAAVGGTATFTVAATYDPSALNTVGQWYFNGVAIAGATNYTYSFTVTKTSFGSYTWSVNDGYYTVTSAAATLRPPPPVVVTPPANTVAAITGSAKFTALGLTYSGLTNYSWYSNSIPISGATNSSLTLVALTSGAFTTGYKVGVNDGYTTVTSTPPATLIMASSPKILSSSVVGTKFVLSFNAQAGPTYVVDYKSNLLQSAWVPVSTNVGASAVLTVTNSATNSQGYYIIQLK